MESQLWFKPITYGIPAVQDIRSGCSSASGQLFVLGGQFPTLHNCFSTDPRDQLIPRQERQNICLGSLQAHTTTDDRSWFTSNMYLLR